MRDRRELRGVLVGAGKFFSGAAEDMSNGHDFSRGLCVGHKDPDLWFSDDPDFVLEVGEEYAKLRVEEARGLCRRCPVQGRCSEYAEDLDLPYGIFGGLTARERAMRG